MLTPQSLHPSVAGTPGRAELADLSRDLFATPLRTPFSRRLQSQLQTVSSLLQNTVAAMKAHIIQTAYTSCSHGLVFKSAFVP